MSSWTPNLVPSNLLQLWFSSSQLLAPPSNPKPQGYLCFLSLPLSVCHSLSLSLSPSLPPPLLPTPKQILLTILVQATIISFLVNCSIVDLQCYVSFRCTRKWFTHIYIYICLYVYISYAHMYIFRFFSLIDYYKILSIVPCGTQ